MSDELPPNWALTNIGTLGRYINGRGFGKAEWKKVGLPIIRIQNLNDETAEFNYSDKDHEQKYRVGDGDLLVAWAASLGVYNWNRGPAWLNQHIFRVEVEERAVTKPFLYYALKHALKALYKKAHGSGMVHVTKGKFDSHPVNLPPLNEQKRIVSKIDELFSRIDEGERALERVQKLVERYRQSVLKAAVTGELTREWREKQAKSGAPVETGEALLTRMLVARREAWEKAELDKMKAKGTKPKDDKWKLKYTEPLSPDTNDLPELPEGWVWVSADQLTSLITDGEHATPPRTEDGIPLLSARNVRDGFLSLDNIDFVSPETHRALQKRLKVRAGDVLLSCSGSVGRTCVVPSGVEFSLVRSVAVLRPVVPIGDYISLTLRSLLLQNQIESRKSQTAQANIFQGSIKKLVFPLPPAEELERVVDAIERQLSLCEDVSRTIGVAEIRSASARQSVLKQAFKGELVEQCTLDEPASSLLKRVATERDAAPVKPKRGSNKKKKTA